MATATAVHPHPTHTTPAGVSPDAWQAAVEAAYTKAQSALPSANGRLADAYALVQAGAVEHAGQFGAQHYTVASQSDPTGLTTYDVHAQQPATCTCEDFTHHAQTRGYACKHILAVWVYKRALEQVTPAPTAIPQTQGPTAAALVAEAAFSLTLRGTLGGHEALLTARGSTYAEFAANVTAVRGLLDPVPTSTAVSPVIPPPTPEGWCMLHGVQMKRQQNERGSWWSHTDGEGWCRGKAKRGA